VRAISAYHRDQQQYNHGNTGNNSGVFHARFIPMMAFLHSIIERARPSSPALTATATKVASSNTSSKDATTNASMTGTVSTATTTRAPLLPLDLTRDSEWPRATDKRLTFVNETDAYLWRALVWFDRMVALKSTSWTTPAAANAPLRRSTASSPISTASSTPTPTTIPPALTEGSGGKDYHGSLMGPSLATYNTILNLFAEIGDAHAMQQWLQKMKSFAPLDIVTYNTLIKGYSHIRDPSLLSSSVSSPPTTATAASVSMRSYYSHVCDIDTMHTYFEEMKAVGLKPTSTTMVILINAFASTGALSRMVWYQYRLPFDGIPVVDSFYVCVWC
jgi:hypothetical protein